MFMMRPQLRRFICGITARMAWKLDDRLIAMIASHFSTGKSSIGAVCWIPALFTRMSTRPNLRVATSIISETSACCDRSAGLNATSTSNFSAMSFCSASMADASPKPFSMILQPPDASAWAIPSPMPLVDPVTIAVIPLGKSRDILVGAERSGRNSAPLLLGKTAHDQFELLRLLLQPGPTEFPDQLGKFVRGQIGIQTPADHRFRISRQLQF